MNKNKNIVLILLISLLFVFSLNFSLAAEEMTLEKAIRQGLNNNLEIRQQQNTIASLERELKTIRARQGWQIEVAANYNEVIDTGNPAAAAGVLNSTNNTMTGSGANTTLNINRSFASGLIISQEAVYNDQEESDYGTIISYPLFSGVPTEKEKEYYQQEQELLKEKNNLNSLIEDKLSSWLESYLQLIRLEQGRKNAELQLKTAKITLSEKKELYNLQQISESELNQAKVDLLDSEIKVSNLKNQYQNALESFKLELSLNKNMSINFDNNQYFNKLQSELINYQKYEFNKLYQIMLSSDYDLQSALINLSLQKKQLEWFQNEGRAEINLSGSYNYSTEKSAVGVTFSYDLFDGGQRELNEENLKENLKLAQDNLENLKEKKKLALESQLNSLNSAINNRESAQLKLNSAEKQLNLAEAQYNSGFIDQTEYTQQQLAYQQNEINYQQAEDQVFIAELELTMFLNNNIREINNEVLNYDKND
ncbi:outer membrane protein TolC [Halanaerobium saccharolyticum]|uniref:Outer membrane protein TolC n=1 Tax=Halanaerobium saccharolyticum TaxID=43595 RepID=A0A4R6L9K2_9FIRM|nr:TolC family protein [Halanaerobium saccharolyticum]TDO71322.1 outer membrane protein TolC [Halanaerobium saccharolyticum]